MVIKQASPPIKLETGSAINTPLAAGDIMYGSRNVIGTTIITFLKSEKNTAFLDLPNAVNTDCPANWKLIIKNPK